MSVFIAIARFIPTLIRILYGIAVATPAILVISTLLSPQAREQAQSAVAATSTVAAAILPLMILMILMNIMNTLTETLRGLAERKEGE